MLKKLFILIVMIMPVLFAGCSQNNESEKHPRVGEGEFLEIETEDMVECSWFYWASDMSENMRPIVLKHSDENAIFECTVDKGNFIFERHANERPYYYLEYVKSFVLKSGDGLPFPIGPDDGSCCHPYPDGFHQCGIDGFCWWPYEIGQEGIPSMDWEIRQAFVEIVLKIDNNIIGYAVVEIFKTYQPDTNYSSFRARVLRSALFPKIDGEYQDVTQEYVKTIIERIKNK